MNFSYPFIRRPVGTTLLAIGLFLAGCIAYSFLPVASLPTVEYPTIRVNASRPGADPETMAATVAAPLERRLGEIAGVTEITSRSGTGSTSIGVQFDLNRNIEGAARDVQAALNAAAADLPSDLPSRPSFRKANPAAAPVLILALTSKTLPPSALYDAADTVVAQRLMQTPGVADVSVSGAEQPAIRVRIDPGLIANTGISFDDVRTAIANANAQGPIGRFEGPALAETIATNPQLRTPDEYRALVVKTVNGNVVRVSDVATVAQATRNTQSAAWFGKQPAVILNITKQADANVIETVDHIRELLPDIKRWIPADIDISIMSDRTSTIRASVHDMQWTLAATIGLVMMVVFVFLRRTAATLAAGVTVPLSLAGTCAGMWLAGFSIDNLSLMALAIAVGFVVDDAIVMLENVFRNLEKGHSPLRATLEGARQIGFTVIAISISLIAAFIPLLFMGGIIGRLFREFSITLAFAIAISTIVSLSVTPMICAHFVKAGPSKDETRFDRIMEAILSGMIRFYGRTLRVVLNHRALTLVVLLATIALTVDLYIKTPKSWFPQDDTGLIWGGTQASPDVSFKAMVDLQTQVRDIVLDDPAVQYAGSWVAGGGGGSVNRGSVFINLKPLNEREGLSSARIVDRLRNKLNNVAGIRLFMVPVQDMRVGARQSSSQYQYTLYTSDLNELTTWVPRVTDKIKTVPGVVDVTTDREQSGLQANVVIDRAMAAQLGVKIQDFNNALNNAFSQRQVSIIYTQRNQYRVILEIDPQYQRDPNDLSRVYVAAAGGTQVPLSAVARVERTIAPLVVNHQGTFPSATITYNLAPDMPLEVASNAIRQAVAELRLPDTLRGDFAGDARAAARDAGSQPVLILAAILAVYIVLGVLYESLAHPLTIISTLPAAGLGALLALQIFHAELSVIAFIGIILLIGIVKKNGIMMVDFALHAERNGLPPEQAIYEACMERFRPILMTTLAALLGAVPLLVAAGPGSELRRPLGMTIIGGLVVSQILTLYTTPVIYLLLDRLHRKLGGRAFAMQWRQRLPTPRPQEG